MTFGSEEHAKQRQQAPEQPKEWLYNGYPHVGDQLEFITKFGVRHLGVAVSTSRNHSKRNYSYGPAQGDVIFMSESVEPTEYFSARQIDKWRVTDELAKRKRFLGSITPEAMEHFGEQTPVFVTYALLRLYDKLDADNFNGSRSQLSETLHYLNENNVHQWETTFSFCGKFVTMVEVKDEPLMMISLDRHTENQGYNYKEVAKAAELITNYLLNQEREA